MIIDLIIAAWAGWETGSFMTFLVLMILAALFLRPESPFSSGILRFALLALGISAIFSLFGGGDDWDV